MDPDTTTTTPPHLRYLGSVPLQGVLWFLWRLLHLVKPLQHLKVWF